MANRHECCVHDEYDDEECVSRNRRRRPKERTKRRPSKKSEPQEPPRIDEDVIYVDFTSDEQLAVLAELQGYFHKRSFQAMSYGALQECDRDFFEAKMATAAINALPYFDPGEGVQLTTFLIEAVENAIIDDARKEKAGRRYAVRVPITQADYAVAKKQGLIAEESLSDCLKGLRKIIFEMDYEAFQKALTPDQKYWLELRLDGIGFQQIADWAGYPLTTFLRDHWSEVRRIATEYGFDKVPSRC